MIDVNDEMNSGPLPLYMDRCSKEGDIKSTSQL